jgi:hypothetical protein
MSQVALVVHACDRYQLLYKGFEYFFKKHWPYKKLPVRFYFLTEEVDLRSEIFTNIKTGKGQWSERLLTGLKQVAEPYIMYLQEDMWFDMPVDPESLADLFSFVASKHPQLVKLSNNPVYHVAPTNQFINGLVINTLDNSRSKYLMSHQVSVWNKELLMDQLIYKEHPWRNERKGTKRLKKIDPVIYHVGLFSENGHAPLGESLAEASVSSYRTISQNAMLKPDTLPFIKEMEVSEDEDIRAYAVQLKNNLKNHITHDGRKPPRKEDIFKRFKRWLLGQKK